MNRWKIPPELEQLVLARDRRCIYCRLDFSQQALSRGMKPSWEHIVNDERIVTEQNIARCCMSCNTSKGARRLEAWLESRYCQCKGISPQTVAAVVKQALDQPPTLS